MPFYYGFDSAYLMIMLVSLVLGLGTQAYIKNTYNKWSKVSVGSGETGAEVARRMLNSEGATSVNIVGTPGHLTDFYDPRDNNLHLSHDNEYGGSIASVAVACHEAGHAVQAAKGYGPYKLRTALAPVVSFTNNAWSMLFFMGIILNLAGLVTLGIWFFAFTVIFQLVTLPVEINASRRAVEYVGANLDPASKRGAKQVLTAAALTYVAAALVSIMQLLYLIGRADRNNN